DRDMTAHRCAKTAASKSTSGIWRAAFCASAVMAYSEQIGCGNGFVFNRSPSGVPKRPPVLQALGWHRGPGLRRRGARDLQFTKTANQTADSSSSAWGGLLGMTTFRWFAPAVTTGER